MQYECSQCGYAFEPFAEEAAGPFCDCPRCGGLAVESQSAASSPISQDQGIIPDANADMRQTLDPLHGQTGSRPLSPNLFENYFESSDPSMPSAPANPSAQEHDPFDDVIESREFDPGDIHREPTMLLDEDGEASLGSVNQNFLPQAPSATVIPQNPLADLPLPPPRHNASAPGFHQEATHMAQEPELPRAPKPITGIMPLEQSEGDDERAYDDGDLHNSEGENGQPFQDAPLEHNEFSDPHLASDIVGIEESPDLERSERIAQERLHSELEQQEVFAEHSDPQYAAQAEAYDDAYEEEDDDDDDEDRPTEVAPNPYLEDLQSAAQDENEPIDSNFDQLPQAPAFSSLLTGSNADEQAQDDDEAELMAAFSGLGSPANDEATRGERRNVRSGGHEAEMLAEAPRSATLDAEYSNPEASLSGEMLISSDSEDLQNYDDDEQALELEDGEIADIHQASDSESEHSGDWMVSGPVRPPELPKPPALPKRRSRKDIERTGEYAQLKDIQLPDLERPADMDDDEVSQKTQKESKSDKSSVNKTSAKKKPRPARADRKEKPARLISVPFVLAILAVSILSLLIGGGTAFWAHEAANKVANLSAQARARKLLGQANKLLANGDNEEAIEILKRAAIDDPSLVEIQRSLGSAYARIKHEDEAAKAYEYYVRMSPNAPDAEEVRSILRKHRGG